MSGQGMLILLSGPSGSGKGTVCSYLVNTYPGMRLSVSATTRQPRPGEVHGRDYYFMSREQFEKLTGEGGFLEWAPIYGNLYGTPVEPVKEVLSQGEDIILRGAYRSRNIFRMPCLFF